MYISVSVKHLTVGLFKKLSRGTLVYILYKISLVIFITLFSETGGKKNNSNLLFINIVKLIKKIHLNKKKRIFDLLLCQTVTNNELSNF